jgi:hypothetical protein
MLGLSMHCAYKDSLVGYLLFLLYRDLPLREIMEAQKDNG